MRIEKVKVVVNGVMLDVQLQFWEDSDSARLVRLFNLWRALNSGMKAIASRGINLPEGISESAFCLYYNKNAGRALKGGSFDAYDTANGSAVQIKASSVEYDLTSFGPKSYWDDLYFLDFYRSGAMDGSFDVYHIENDLIYNMRLSSSQTFRDQQQQGRRPRFSIKRDIIEELNLAPERTCRIEVVHADG